MFELFFGIIWNALMVFFTWGFYHSNMGTITVNGEIVSQEEFSGMLMPKLFIGLFWAIGLFIMFRGIKKIIRDSSTSIKGEICFGRICDIYNSGATVNGRPELKADVIVYVPSAQKTRMISEIIGFDRNKYRYGDYVQLKYYNGDINFEGNIEESILPFYIQEELSKSLPESNFNSKDTIKIDGVEYVRKDSFRKI